MITLILGGARSGKSRFAEMVATYTDKPKLYIATSEATDDEMRTRIAKHRQDRAEDGWHTIEAPLAIADIVTDAYYSNHVMLIDCLTLWLNNVLYYNKDVAAMREELLAALQETKADVIMVSNEIGLGIVPEHKLARQFRDEAGILHQRIAAMADKVVLMVAGLPVNVKG